MIMPLFDDNTDRRSTPWVNYTLLGLNVLVFVLFQQLGANEDFTFAWSLVPEEIVTGRDIHEQAGTTVENPLTGRQRDRPPLRPTPITVYLTLLTSMFMHGGLAHLFGNMLFLWIFGDNLEDSMGPVRYLCFYVTCGLAASAAHIAATYGFGGNPLIPCLGASGAISGVLGGYVLLFPHRRVTVLMFRFLTEVPAFVAIGMWFGFQLLQGLGALGSQTGGVAYGAHIGGFVAGLALVRLFAVGITIAPVRANPRDPFKFYRR